LLILAQDSPQSVQIVKLKGRKSVSVSRLRFDNTSKYEVKLPERPATLRFGPLRWRELSDLGDFGR
jgi:hypothetical protein